MTGRFPPGPPNYNAWCGLTWRHAWQLSADRLSFVSELERKYGDIAFYRLFTYPSYQVNHPDLIREVLVTKSKSFVKQPRHMDVIRQVAGTSVLTTEGQEWQQLRRIVAPAFLSQGGPRMAEIGAVHLERLMGRWQPGKPLAMHAEMVELMVRTAGEALLGASNDDRAAELGQAMQVISEAVLEQIAWVFHLPGWVPGSARGRLKKANDYVAGVVDEVIRVRQQQADRPRDLLDLVLGAVDHEGDGRGLTPAQVRAEAVTMYFAGHHTAATCLAWTFLLLAENPAVEQRLVAEIEDVLEGRDPTPADLPHLKYTERVLQESMRIYPPAWALFARQAVEEVEIGGYTLPRNAWVFIYPWVVHRSPRFFPDPLRFDPDRFLPERAATILPGAYIPFGLGGHACVGNKMAMATVTLLLAKMLQRFQFRLAPGADPHQAEAVISLRPKHDIPLFVEPRSRQRS